VKCFQRTMCGVCCKEIDVKDLEIPGINYLLFMVACFVITWIVGVGAGNKYKEKEKLERVKVLTPVVSIRSK